jgi:hypothetical protein
MKSFVLFLALAAGIATAVPAHATYCSTTCSGYGNTRTCNTVCF